MDSAHILPKKRIITFISALEMLILFYLSKLVKNNKRAISIN